MKSRFTLPVVAVLALGGLVACSDSTSSSSTEAPTSAPATTEAPTTTAPTTEAPTTAAPTSAVPTTAEAALVTIPEIPGETELIVAMWEKFLDKTTPAADRFAVLEEADALKQAFDLAVTNPVLAQASAKVVSVAFTSETTAVVTYDILLNDTPALPGQKGDAVKVDGEWRFGKKAFCGLAQLALGSSAPGCEA